MRAHEFIIEAIDLLQYREDVENIIKNSLKDGLSSLTKSLENSMLGRENEKTESWYDLVNNPNGYHYKSYLNTVIQRLGYQLKEFFTKEVDPPLVIDNVYFKDSFQGKAVAYVQGDNVYFTKEQITSIAEEFLEKMNNVAYDNLDTPEYVVQFFIDFMKNIKSRHLEYGYDAANYQIRDFSKLILHEFVHLAQGSRQKHRADMDIEYRSYLSKGGKYGSEFRNLDLGIPKSDADTSRYYQLWVTSPQEMASTAHEFASEFLSDYYDKPEYLDTPEDIKNWTDNVRDMIKSTVPNFVSDKMKLYGVDPKSSSYIRKIYQKHVGMVTNLLNRRIERDLAHAIKDKPELKNWNRKTPVFNKPN